MKFYPTQPVYVLLSPWNNYSYACAYLYRAVSYATDDEDFLLALVRSSLRGKSMRNVPRPSRDPRKPIILRLIITVRELKHFYGIVCLDNNHYPAKG